MGPLSPEATTLLGVLARPRLDFLQRRADLRGVGMTVNTTLKDLRGGGIGWAVSTTVDTVDTTVNTTVDHREAPCVLAAGCTLTGLKAAHRGQDGGLRRAYSCRRLQACEAGRVV